jgi:hypothetical protein
MNARLTLAVLLALGLGPAHHLSAAPLTRAEVSQIQNDVRIVTPESAPRPARLRDSIQGRSGLRTGSESRAELTFEDNTLARLGANTLFRFEQGTRDLELDRGTILLQVPKGAGGATIKTAAVTAAITGTTILIEYTPASGNNPGYIKIIVLEGQLRVALKKRKGESLVMGPGEFLMLTPDADRLPEPVLIDLERLVQTSPLIRDRFAQLASDGLIRREIGRQSDWLEIGELLETNLSLFGEGNVVWLTEGPRGAVADSFPPTGGQNGQGGPNGGSAGDPDGSPGGGGSPGGSPGSPGGGGPVPPSKYGPPPVIPGPYVVNNSTVIVTDPTITTNNVTHEGRIYRDPAQDGPLSQYLFGGTSAFDGQLGVDGGGGPGAPLSVFKFESLRLDGGATYNTVGGPTRVALISRDGITTGPSIAPIGMTLYGIDHMALATVNGPITVGPLFGFYSAGASLQLYARGAAADLDFQGQLSFGNAEFQSRFADTSLAAERDLFIDGDFYGRDLSLRAGRDLVQSTDAGGLNAARLDIRAGGNITLNGYTESDFIYADAGGTLTLDGDSFHASGQADFVAERVVVGETQVQTYNTPASSSIPSLGLRSRATSGTGIQIQNSSQLLALADTAGTKAHVLIQTQGGGVVIAGGAEITANSTNGADQARVEIHSNGGPVTVGDVGGTGPPAVIQAVGGILEIDTQNAAVDGIVNLYNSTLAADTLRIRAYGPNGQLNIHGGTLSAATQLKLYAGGSNGIVRFLNNTALNTGSGVNAIAAKTIRVDDSVVVTVNGGRLKLFGDNLQFNEINGGDDSTSGYFTGSGAPSPADVEAFNSANKPPFP